MTSVRVHRRLKSLRGLFRRVAAGHAEGLPRPFVQAAGPLTERLDELDRDVIELRDRSRLLQKELSARVAEQTNRNLRLLSLVTALFLPPALIAGLFGMNVDGLPFAGSPAGFWLSMLISVLSSAVAPLGLKLGC